MWTPQNRKRYDRNRLRYPSDLTDEEWAHVAPVIPPATPGGNKRTVGVREVMNGVMYVLSTGCQWRALPKDLPPKSTVHDYFILWSCDIAQRSRFCALPQSGSCSENFVILTDVFGQTLRAVASILGGGGPFPCE